MWNVQLIWYADQEIILTNIDLYDLLIHLNIQLYWKSIVP